MNKVYSIDGDDWYGLICIFIGIVCISLVLSWYIRNNNPKEVSYITEYKVWVHTYEDFWRIIDMDGAKIKSKLYLKRKYNNLKECILEFKR